MHRFIINNKIYWTSADSGYSQSYATPVSIYRIRGICVAGEFAWSVDQRMRSIFVANSSTTLLCTALLRACVSLVALESTIVTVDG